jgi:flagellar protein FlaJ
MFLNPEKYPELRQSLQKLRRPISLDQYLSRAFWASVSVGIVVPFVVFTFLILLGAGLLLRFLVLLLCPLLAYTAWRLFLWYPWSAAKGREAKIDAMLPSAASFMYALSKGGLNVIEIFRALSQEKEDYGEIAVEAAAIVREVDYFGNDPITAIRNVAQTTPSEKFRRLLEFLVPVVQTGSSLSDYFALKCKELYQAAEVDQKRYLDTLAFFAEFYVILMLFAPLILIVTLMAVSSFYGTSTLVLYLLAYLMIPLGSIMFIILMSVKTIGGVSAKKVEKKRYFTKIKPANANEKKMLRSLVAMETMPELLKNPLRAFKRQPYQVAYFSGGAASIFLILHLGSIDLPVLFFAFLIFSVPLCIFYTLWERRLEKTLDVMPEFLHAFASAVSSGIPPARAIRLIPTGELGPLKEEVEQMVRIVSWGEPAVVGLSKVEKECGHSYLSRTLSVVRRACVARDDIGDVLQILATDATQLRNLKRERWASMFSYALIIYISFAVFLFCMVMLTRFTSTMGRVELPRLPETAGGMSLPISFQQTGTPPVVWHATFIQAFFSGLIAGKFSTGRLLSGLKHSIIMMTIAFVVYCLFG